MLKSILNLKNVETLSTNELQSINGKGAVLTKVGLCSVHFGVCNVAYPNDHDKFVKCMERKGC
ncbi:hypothetical protein [uncultured Aquimarina sp.]|uniref:hypothetical protein n=1 Tax=uncultured Aquimarina sp. TaxID=575652 RepID=UPI00260E5062|nr:hypothetical protein [uncultured Aquimarina sp.]